MMIYVDSVGIEAKRVRIVYNGKKEIVFEGYSGCQFDGEYIVCQTLDDKFRVEMSADKFDFVMIEKSDGTYDFIEGRRKEVK
jgi:hypothetical protein